MRYYFYKSILTKCLGILILTICLMTSSCAYRFTNVAMSAPTGIQSIAIEGVYDTSREVIPHEVLWNAVAEEFAKNGRLTVTSKEEADALVTIHITQAEVSPTGAPSAESIDRDPPIGTNNYPDPFAFKNLKKAGSWTTDEAISYTININIYNLYTRQTLFKRSYATSGNFKSIRASTVAQTRTGYLLYHEALQARMRSLSQGLARKIVTDFLL